MSTENHISRRQVLTDGARLGAGALLALTGIATLAACRSEGAASKGAATDEEARTQATPEELVILEKYGLTGPHALIDLRQIATSEIHGQVSGGMVFVNGEIDGKTVQELQFAWQTNTDEPTIYISHIPLDKVAFKKPNPDIKDPQRAVEFAYNMDKLIRTNACGITKDDGVCGFTTDFGDNPQAYVNNAFVNKATITMTEQQFKEFASPQK